METFKDIPGYEGIYQVSNLGNVKSLWRNISKILIPILTVRGYLQVSLCKNKTIKIYRVHQLVAIAFLNFKPDGHKLVINHINFKRIDNRLDNLEIVTNRENCNLKHIKSSSQYNGVSFRKDRNKWAAEIKINGKRLKLGHYSIEEDAHLAYQTALNKHLKENI